MSNLLYDKNGVQLWLGLAENLGMLPDESVDLSVFSPPYNIKTGKGGAWNVTDWYSDDLPEDVYQQSQVAVLNEVWRVAKNGTSLFYNHKVRQRNRRGIHPWSWVSKSKWELVQQITWDRGSTHNHTPGYFYPQDELIFWLCKGDPYFDNTYGKFSTVWRMNFVTNSPHPAPFPEELPVRCILACSKPGDLVLDPYVGSGTTVRVASRLGRRAIGVDKEERYLRELAIPSLSQMSML